MDLKYGEREKWLKEAMSHMESWFGRDGINGLPKIRVACGWAKRAKPKSIGVCWPAKTSSDGTNEIQISPEIEEPVKVLATLLHEMIHASDDCESKHAGYFKRTALALGLEGKMTATVPGDDLLRKLQGIASELGHYPHAAMNPAAATTKQTTRMIKIVCPSDGCTMRTSQKWIEFGLPTCYCGTDMEVAS